jgi:CheY-like chemotaxis protein
MHRIDDKPSGLKKSTVKGLEVKLWEIYLTRSRKNLFNVLSSYSIDNGPVRKSQEDHDRVHFRFTTYDWEKSVMPLCCGHHIPFEIVGGFTLDTNAHPIKKRVYVAEDDLNILFALNTMLEAAGYDVLLAHCGQPMMEPNLPATDLFILDKRMPGADGIEICKHLRKQDYTKDIPVIMISASRNSQGEALAAGVNDFLEKPFHMKDLLRLVHKHTSATAGEGINMQVH